MTEHHPISPPPELVRNWWEEGIDLGRADLHTATCAAQWGADQELDAICHWLRTGPYGASIACHAEQMISDLRAARRPKPPSLKQQAIAVLDDVDANLLGAAHYNVLLRALEALPDD